MTATASAEVSREAPPPTSDTDARAQQDSRASRTAPPMPSPHHRAARERFGALLAEAGAGFAGGVSCTPVGVQETVSVPSMDGSVLSLVGDQRRTVAVEQKRLGRAPALLMPEQLACPPRDLTGALQRRLVVRTGHQADDRRARTGERRAVGARDEQRLTHGIEVRDRGEAVRFVEPVVHAGTE